jgi:hypothetical protein
MRTGIPGYRPPALVLTALVSTLGGCFATHPNPEVLQILGSVAAVRQPGAQSAGTPGVCMPESTSYLRAKGILDLAVARDYVLWPWVRNRLPPTEMVSGNGPQHLRLDASTITLSGAQMTLHVSPSAVGTNKPLGKTFLGATTDPSTKTWYVPVGGVLQAECELIPPVDLVGAEVGAQMQIDFKKYSTKYETIVPTIVDIQLFGTMADGTPVESGLFPFPVDLCWGCLLTPLQVPQGVGLDLDQIWASCVKKQVPSEYAPPCAPGNDEQMPCGLYCHTCSLDNTCDPRFCPSL